MDFVEWQLWRVEPGGQTKELLSPISLQDGLNVGKLSSIRSFLEENDLLEFKFAFWNEKTGSIISHKFEKANVIKGPEVFIIPVDDVETSSKRAQIQTEEEKNPLILGDSKDDETIEWQDADSQEYASLLVDLAKAPTQKPVGDRATTLETTVTVHETEVGNSPSGSLEKMRSLIMRTDEKGSWERGARNLKDKLEGEGKGDHSWWHIPTTLHKTEYNRRVGNDKIAKERSATEHVALAIAEQRKRVTNAVQLIKAANDQEGHQSFLIDGDVENETLSGKDVKWKCVFCGTPHLLMPKTNNLASTLQQHMAGDRHIQKKKQALEDLANQTPLRSGQRGCPTWKSKMLEDKQPGIKVFFKETPKGLNKGSSGASSSKGINDQSTLCWGLWQDTVIVNGEEKDYYCRVWREQRSIEKRGQRDTGNGRRFEVLSIEELPKVVREKNRSYRKVVRENWMLKVKLMRFKAEKKSFSRVQEEFANRSEVSLFCHLIIKSWRDGLWGGKQALWDFMADVAQNISRKKQGGRFNSNTKVMWEVVKLRVGPAISNFLTHNLCGPSISTIKRDGKKDFQYVVGESEDQFQHIAEMYAKLKEKLGIIGPVPVIIAEDETSIKKMIR
ncbi:unnamed protein product [Calypogeia fissa]